MCKGGEGGRGIVRRMCQERAIESNEILVKFLKAQASLEWLTGLFNVILKTLKIFKK